MAFRNDPFSNLFEELMNRTFVPPAEREARAKTAPGGHWTPAVNAFVDGGKFVLEVMLAGVDPKTVELTATGNSLVVKGTRERKAPATSTFKHTEVIYGPFERAVELPEGTDSSRAEARFENGVLQITLPALGAFVPRKIDILAGGSAPEPPASHA